MPRDTFDPENRAKDFTNYPKLKLDENEKKRIVVIEETPFFEWVHRLEMPKIGPQGQAIMTNKERKNGETYQVHSMEFLSQPICLGDLATMKEEGSDEEHCPMCKIGRQTDMLKPATRRYASHVLVYNTKPGTFDITEPFMLQCILWVYGERRYNRLLDIISEFGPLREHDLTLGPCSNASYQNYDINGSNKAEWATTKDRQRMAVMAFKENKLDDKQIKDMLGRTIAREFILEDLQRIQDRWRRIKGVTGPSSGDQTIQGASLEDGLAGLLDDEEKKPDPMTEAPGKAVPDDSDESTAEATPDKGEESVNFDDLLGEFSK